MLDVLKSEIFPCLFIRFVGYFCIECGAIRQESNMVYALHTSALKPLKSFAAGK
jgi:hypothetical protein